VKSKTVALMSPLQLSGVDPGLCLLLRTAAVLKQGIDFQDWAKVGRELCRMAGGSMWWIGGWINYAEREFLKTDEGKKRYGIKYRAALEVSGLERETLYNAAWVDRAVNCSNRLEQLSWSHHREVAHLKAEEQKKFLNMALEKHWTRSQLRQAIRKAGKTEVDEPIINVGFVPGRWGSELQRGFRAEIERLGPLEKWHSAVLEAWKEGLAVAVGIYQEIQRASPPGKESISAKNPSRLRRCGLGFS